MTWELFWEGDPNAVIYYRRAHEMKVEAENQKMWLMGAYIYDVMCRVYPAFNPMVKKGSKVTNYMDAPFPIHPKSEKKESEFGDVDTYNRIRNKMAKFIESNNKRIKEGG